MKRNFLNIILLAGLGLSAHAGVDTKVDTKEMMQISPTPRTDAGFYVAALGGSQFSTNYGDNRQTEDDGIFGLSASSTTKIHSDWGGVGGLKAGYNFNSFPVGTFMSLRLQPAVEAEALYIGDNSHVSDDTGPGSLTRFSSNSGDFFLNGILRFKNSTIVTPYIGIGAGLQYITTHGESSIPPSAPVPMGVIGTGLDTSDLDFAGQALFGLDFAVCQHVSIFTEYKFIDAIGTDGKSTNVPTSIGGGTYRFKPDQIQQNLITAGVKYQF
jgi:opacity protein-like surface antigen